MMLTRNDRVRLLALSYTDSLPAGAVSNWDGRILSEGKSDPVARAAALRLDYSSHGEFEDAYKRLPVKWRAALEDVYFTQKRPADKISEQAVQLIARVMPSRIMLPREVMENHRVLLERVKKPMARFTTSNMLYKAGTGRELSGAHPDPADLVTPQLYFAHRGAHIKIGRSRYPETRVKALRAKLIAVMPETPGLEIKIQERFAHLREDVPYVQHTEWFRDCDELRSFIDENASKAH